MIFFNLRKNRKYFFNNFPLIFIILFAIVPFIWFRTGTLIGGGDNYFLLNPGALTNFFIYSWNNKIVNTGGVILAIPNLFPLLYFWTFFQSLNFSLEIIEKIWIIFLFVLPGITIYYLISQIYNRFWVKIIASILWMINLFFVVAGPFQSTIKPIFIVLPLIFSFWVKGLGSKGNEYLKYAFLIALSSLICASSSINPPALASIPLVLIVYLFFYLFIEKGNIFRSLRFALVSFFGYIIANLWWIIIFISNLFSEAKAIKATTSFSALGEGFITEYFRLLGSWGWTSGAYSMPYYPFARFYNEPFLLAATFLITILVFLAVMLKPKEKLVCFFSFLALVGLFFSKGDSYPLGSVYNWMYKNIPGFWTFREPFAKFTPVTIFAYSILLGISTESIYEKIKKWTFFVKRKINLLPVLFPLVIIFLILAVSYPIFNGEVIWDYHNGSMRSNYFKVPDYWYQAGDWLSQEDINARVLTMPKSGYGVAYNWEHGFSTADSPAIILFKNPILRLATVKTGADYLVSKVYDSVYFGLPQSSIDILSLLNTKYVVQQNDLDWRYSYSDTLSPKQMKDVLSRQKDLRFVRNFGMLDFYQLKNEAYLPRFYVPETKIISNFEKSDLGEIFNFIGEQKRIAIFLTDSLRDFSKTDSFNNPEQVIEIKTKSLVLPEQYSLMEEILNISVPYSGNRPGGLMYRLGKIKEFVDKKRSEGNMLKSIDKNLFYAAKRLREISNYGDQDDYLLRSLFTEFDESIKKLYLLKEENNGHFLKYFKKTEAMVYFIYETIEKGEVDVVSGELIENNFSNYFDLLSLLNKSPEVDSGYDFVLSQAGTYNLYLKSDDQYTDYGIRYFDSGRQNLTLTDDNGKNLVGEKNKIIDFSPNTLYKLSFEYQKSFNSRGSVLIGQSETEVIFYLNLLPTGGKEKKFETYFLSPPTNSSKDFLIKYNIPVVKNLKVEKVNFSSLVLKKIGQQTEVFSIPQIEFLKINPTKYIVKVNNADKAYGLVFSENFHQGWKLFYKDFSEDPFEKSYEKEFTYFSNEVKEYIGPMKFFDKYFFSTLFNKPIPQDTHLSVNGYANYWQIRPEDVNSKKSYYLVVEFVPQRLFHLGVLISVLGVLSAVVYLFSLRLKGKK